MPDDPILVADTQGWLRKAASDLRAAKHDLAASPPLLSDTAFHCQQAVGNKCLFGRLPEKARYRLPETTIINLKKRERAL